MSRIDSYISLHFEDLPASPSGGTEGFVEERRPVRTMRGMRGGAEAVRSPEPTARRPRIPVLLNLKRADWDKNIEGLQKGSRLGRILSAVATEQAIRELEADPDIISVEASRSGGTPECVHSMPWVGVPKVRAAPLSEKGAGAIVAVIDGGIDVLHEAFRSGNQSRILALWDQYDSSGPTPHKVKPNVYSQDYGTLHTRTDITGYVQTGAPGKNLQRDGADGHGTHVTSIAAGTPLPAVGFPGGVAPEADIVVVIPKLSASPGDPASLGYSMAHVDALAFVRATADDAGAPVAVNVSLGMNAGAHDGSSLLELAFDSFSGGGREPGYVVVKSAGNEFDFDGHASVQAFHGGVIPIEWTTKKMPRSEDYLEFWFRASDDLKFTLVAPSGLTCWVDRSKPDDSANAPGGALSMYLRLTRFHVDNGDSRLVVLVRNNQGGSVTESGQWRLDIEGTAVFDGTVHGWVERDSARAVHFDTGSANELTLSIPSTARTVIAVGACQASDPLRLLRFSSRGPTRDDRRKPELVAPGVDIVAAQAGTATGLVAMSGTSMAAPHVTGAVALLLARRARAKQPQLNASQIKAALSQCLKNFTGHWQPGFGNGALDVERLLKAFG
jgi:subtilisin family serine protease